MSIRSVISVSICILGLLLLLPAVSAGGMADATNQTHITENRDRIMNTSHVTEVMMQGAIQYIDQISNGSGTTVLQATRDNYVSAVASIPSILNGTEFRTTGMDLRQIEHLFFNQTQAAVKTYNGTPSDLKESINATLTAAGLTERGFGPRPDFAVNGTARPDHAPDFAVNGTAHADHAPDFAVNGTARPDHAPDFAVNGTARPDHAPDFAVNGTARPDHAPDFAVNGTSHAAGNVSCPADNGFTMPGNGPAGRHSRGVNATVS